jgi:hypothetical protein
MKNANDFSGYGNEVLCRMCDERPEHKVKDIIASKIWIIGRAYAATIEGGLENERKEWIFAKI